MSVVGHGERKHPKNGNATLVTLDLQEKRVTTPLWLSSFATDLNMELDSTQRRKGLSHRPIRISERFLMFSALWNVRDRQEYLQFVKTLKEHWATNFNENRPTPMKLTYYGANKTWLGFIENASFAFAVTDVILSYQFQMRLITTPTDRISKVGGINAPYVPSRGDVENFGKNWYGINEFLADTVGTGNEQGRPPRAQTAGNQLSPSGSFRPHGADTGD